MSLVLSPPPPPRSPHHIPISRSSTPSSSPASQPRTPPLSPTAKHSTPFAPSASNLNINSTPPSASRLGKDNIVEVLSAPTTPVTVKYAHGPELSTGMERCRSSEPAYNHPIFSLARSNQDRSRGREPKATTLKFGRVPSHGDIQSIETASLPPSPSALRAAFVPPSEPSSAPLPQEGHMPNQDVPELGPVLGPPVTDDAMDVDEPPLSQNRDDVSVVDNSLDEGSGEFASMEGLITAAESSHRVWGMPKWGTHDRQEVRPGVRMLSAEELPDLIEQHAMVDTPSHVLFPWLHGISDDGKKGTNMAAFFGLYPPFEPPSYRGLTVLFASSRLLAKCSPEKSPSPVPERPPLPHRENSQMAPPTLADIPSTSPSDASSQTNGSRGRSETMSTDSYMSSGGTTEATSPSIGDIKELSSSIPRLSPAFSSPDIPLPITEEPSPDVEMHPCEPKRANSDAADRDREQSSSLPRDDTIGTITMEQANSEDPDSFIEVDQWGQELPNSLLLNALFVDEIFEGITNEEVDGQIPPPRFCASNLPRNINLRNLNIQPVKYATISDVVLYARKGCTDSVLALAETVAAAQDCLYNERILEYYQHVVDGEGEGINRPIKYGVWVVQEPFSKIEAVAPHLVNVTSQGESASHPFFMDVFDRENKESRAMTRATEVVEGFWVGNESDVPGNGNPDDSEAQVRFDVCIRAWELGSIPNAQELKKAHEKIMEMDDEQVEQPRRQSDFNPSPATVALRNLLSPNTSSPSLPESGGAGVKRAATDSKDGERNARNPAKAARYVPITVSGCSRTAGMSGVRPKEMIDRLVALVYWLRKLIEGRDGTKSRPRNVLVYCQDGYTENSLLALAYIMSSLSISLPEAYLHLQNTAQRSFFLFTGDKPMLRKIDERFAADRKAKALKLLSQTSLDKSPGLKDDNLPSPTGTRWKNWGLAFGKSDATTAASGPDGPSSPRSYASAKDAKKREAEEARHLVEMARKMLEEEEQGGKQSAKDARVWFEDKRFDGFPSRILPFLYLGNLEHAGNAAMLQALSITHVVSVGESLINCDADSDPMYGKLGDNTLSAAHKSGRIQVLDLNDVRDDGNDPLRPIIARACEWIEAARQAGGRVLVHCRVGVSRSASIVMAYMMQYHRLGLMDAYLVTRARRLNVLIQPNLRFYHELFGWEIELAKREIEDPSMDFTGVMDGYAERSNAPMSLPVVVGRRKILYSWPAFCRELYYLNRRFLCN